MQKKSIVLAIGLALTAPVALAESDKVELEKLRAMVQELDQKIRALEREIERKNAGAAQAVASAAAGNRTATGATPGVNASPGVTFYGQVDLSYDAIDTGTAANGAAGASKGNVSSNVSRVGFKGTEGLGDGLAAIWQIEQQINIDNAGGTFATRNSFVGLRSDGAGTVLLGRYDTPYKLATRRLDLFADSIADNRALMGGVAGKSANTAFDGRPTDTIAYTTPSMKGFSGTVSYANLNETGVGTGSAPVAGTPNGKNSLLSVAGMYDVAPLYGSLGYEEHRLDTVQAGARESAWKLGLGYTLDAFMLGFAYERSSDNLTPVTYADRYGHDAYYLSGQYKFGKDAVRLAYGKANQTGNAANTGANQFSLGYDHGLGKRTKLYAIYSRIANQSKGSYGFTQSSAAAGTVNGTGASPTALSLGMRHTF